MLLATAITTVVALPSFVAGDSALSGTFGPKHCVSVSRNDRTGTCVLKTNCENVKLDDVEFAFTCKKPGKIQKHSFGKGGFDLVEEFDTSVKCDVCGMPAEVAMSLKQAQFLSSKNLSAPLVVREKPHDSAAQRDVKLVSHNQEPGQQAEVTPASGPEEPAATPPTGSAPPSQEAQAPSEVSKVSYGPQNCITTWLQKDAATTSTTTTTGGFADSSETSTTATTTVPITDGESGVCIVETNCGHIPSSEFTEYPIGVIAVNKDNVPARHLFGKDSFDPREEFNTLIRASACVGMDQTSEAITLDNEVKALSRIVFSLKSQVQKLAGMASTETSLIRKDHEILVRNEEAAERERVEEERERREEDREQQLRDERAVERGEEDQDNGSVAQLSDEIDGDEDAYKDLPPEFRNEHEERMTRRERERDA